MSEGHIEIWKLTSLPSWRINEVEKYDRWERTRQFKPHNILWKLEAKEYGVNGKIEAVEIREETIKKIIRIKEIENIVIGKILVRLQIGR